MEPEVRIAELRRKIAMQRKIITSLTKQSADLKIAQRLLDRLERDLETLTL